MISDPGLSLDGFSNFEEAISMWEVDPRLRSLHLLQRTLMGCFSLVDLLLDLGEGFIFSRQDPFIGTGQDELASFLLA